VGSVMRKKKGVDRFGTEEVTRGGEDEEGGQRMIASMISTRYGCRRRSGGRWLCCSMERRHLGIANPNFPNTPSYTPQTHLPNWWRHTGMAAWAVPIRLVGHGV
jgi:hypothetical protein